MRTLLLLAAALTCVVATQCIVATAGRDYGNSIGTIPPNKTYVGMLELESGASIQPVVDIVTNNEEAITDSTQFFNNGSQIIVYAYDHGVYNAYFYDAQTGGRIASINLGKQETVREQGGQLYVLTGNVYCFFIPTYTGENSMNTLSRLICNATGDAFVDVWMQPNDTAAVVAAVTGGGKPLMALMVFELPGDGSPHPPIVTTATISVFDVSTKTIASMSTITGLEYWGYFTNRQFLPLPVMGTLIVTDATTGAALFASTNQAGGYTGSGDAGNWLVKPRPESSASTSSSQGSTTSTSAYHAANDQIIVFAIDSIYSSGAASIQGTLQIEQDLEPSYFYYTGSAWYVLAADPESYGFTVYYWAAGMATSYSFQDPDYDGSSGASCSPTNIFCF